MQRPALVALVACLALVAAACTAGSSPSGGSGASSPGAAVRSGDVALPPVVLDPILADAATRTGLPAEALVIQVAEPRTYSDGSLDCPEPGMMYTQAIVEGYQVVIAAGDDVLDYRGSDPGVFRLCTQ
jgi:hypothetical protein